jgi:hypothetical protein
MKIPAKRQLAKAMLLLATIFLTSSPAPAATYLFEGSPAVGSSHLDSMRGGFLTSNQGFLSLGITKVTSIDGILQVTNTLHIPDLTRLGSMRGSFATNTVYHRPAHPEVLPVPSEAPVASQDHPTRSTASQSSSAPPATSPVAVAPSNLPTENGLLVLNNGFSTLIQNSLDQKTIQNLTIVEASVANVKLFREIELMARINEQLINAMR